MDVYSVEDRESTEKRTDKLKLTQKLIRSMCLPFRKNIVSVSHVSCEISNFPTAMIIHVTVVISGVLLSLVLRS